MTLPRVTAEIVKLGDMLDRADTPGELDAIWLLNDMAGYSGAARAYLETRRRQVEARLALNAEARRLARAY